MTIATLGNAQDFGDLTMQMQKCLQHLHKCVDYLLVVRLQQGWTNVIDFVTISTAGDATDFGDLTVASDEGISMWIF